MEQGTPQIKARTPIANWLIVALLVAILAVQAYALSIVQQQAQAQAARSETCQAAADELTVTMANLVTLYDEAVYKNPKTDTIQKQTLMALEYQLIQQIKLANFLSECY